MLHRTNELYGYKLAAQDGDIGQVTDFYFDDKTWVVRYLVADTGPWLAGRLVLLAPHAFGPIDGKGQLLHVNLTRRQVEYSPPIETHQPVSRQYEASYYQYYGWPAYWDGGATWGLGGGYPGAMPPADDGSTAPTNRVHRKEKHLQSTRAVTGYAIQTIDGPIGHVTGLLVDDQSWAVRDLVVETGHWYAGKEVFVAPNKIEQISYEDSKVVVNLTKGDIESAAENEVAQAGNGRDLAVD